MKNILKIGTFMIILLFLVIPVNACRAEIISWEYGPDPVNGGRDVSILANVRFNVDVGDRNWWDLDLLDPSCQFLVGAAIVPSDDLFSIVVEQYPKQCCPANKNFASNYVKIKCTGFNQLSCEEVVQVRLILKAPYEGFCDHCAGMGGNTNPDCILSPDLYWKGEGIYKIKFGIFKGCYYDLVEKEETQYVYDLETRNIDVKDVGAPTPTDDIFDELNKDIDFGIFRIKTWIVLVLISICVIFVLKNKTKK